MSKHQLPEGLQQLVNVNEACAALGIKRTRLYELIAQKKLRSVSIGARRLFRVTDINSFIDEVSRDAA